MPDRDWTIEARVATERLDALTRLPVIPTWSRLEPMTVTRGDLTPGTQALVADPLWLLGRQWQFDELRGEDAGSPVLATLSGECAPFSRFHAGVPDDDASDDAVDLPIPGTPGAVPLETAVEAEIPDVPPLRLRIQVGLHLVRLLRSAGFVAVADAATAAWPVVLDPVAGPGGAVLEDPVGEARARLAAGRVPDGWAVLAAVNDLDDGAGGLSGVPAALTAAAAAAVDDVRDVMTAWRAWASSLVSPPTVAGGTSWQPGRLEHRFAAQASMSDGPVVMRVDEYTGGTLDWFHGDLAEGPDLGAPTAPDAAAPVPFTDHTLPSPVRFAGMPSDRLFAFEDSRVYLGGLEAGRTDLARMAVVEFALAYSVDWFSVPLVLPYGSATRITGLRVVDSFGVAVDVDPARDVTTPGWTVFQSTPVSDTSTLADVFVLAPTVARVLEGEPLEEVALFRDEMANLVWGVERVVPGPSSGEPVPRARQAARVTLRQAAPEDLGDAAIVYRLMTPVPENWLPFVAVRARPADPESHPVLERRPMLRYRPDGQPELVNPLGTLLVSAPGVDPATDRLRIAEEEVPRDGVVVTRSFQQARTEDGGTVLWIGRRVRTGQGEGASGLRFDTALPPGAV